MGFAISLVTLATIYILASIGAGWLQQRLSIISLGHAVVIGMASYCYAVLAKNGVQFFFVLIIVLIITSVVGAILVCVSQWLDYQNYALFTFAIQTIWYGFITNAIGVTGGALGIASIPQLPSFSTDGNIHLFIWSGVFITTSIMLLKVVDMPRFVHMSKVISTSNELASTLGFNPLLFRLGIGLVYGVLLGLAGILLAAHLTFINSSLFTISMSVVILAIGFFSMFGRFIGPIIGAVLIILVPELTRLIGMTTSKIGFFQECIAGITLLCAIFIMHREKSNRKTLC